MTFRETLEEHLRAIKQRDLEALICTLPEGELTLIRTDGRLVRSVQEFVDLHRDWFSSTSWTIETRLEELTESSSLGLAVVHQTYRDETPEGDRIFEHCFRTLAFARQETRWVLIHNQGTPIRCSR